jgi:hypothetical protein
VRAEGIGEHVRKIGDGSKQLVETFSKLKRSVNLKDKTLPTAEMKNPPINPTKNKHTAGLINFSEAAEIKKEEIFEKLQTMKKALNANKSRNKNIISDSQLETKEAAEPRPKKKIDRGYFFDTLL